MIPDPVRISNSDSIFYCHAIVSWIILSCGLYILCTYAGMVSWNTDEGHNTGFSQPRATREMASPGKGRISVLCVDDEQGFLDLEKRLLEQQGIFEVDTARSASQAVAAFQHKNYDAVVADYQMPEKTGLDLLAELRQDYRCPFYPVHRKGARGDRS